MTLRLKTRETFDDADDTVIRATASLVDQHLRDSLEVTQFDDLQRTVVRETRMVIMDRPPDT